MTGGGEPDAPTLTFPAEVADLVRETYAGATEILEYGSGGSTALAAELGTRCMSVENDLVWARHLGRWLDAAHPGHRVTQHKVWIGPTRKWGRPSKSQARLWRWRYPAYPRSVWRRRDRVMPDVVLIDGRFRPACFLTTLERLDRPATILWDDYANRPDYHVVVSKLAPAHLVGRMAVFHAVPGLVDATDLRSARALFFQPE